jgi:hypothetical protein
MHDGYIYRLKASTGAVESRSLGDATTFAAPDIGRTGRIGHIGTTTI